MITRKEFHSIVKELLYLRKAEANLSKAFKAFDHDFNSVHFGGYEGLIVKLITHLFNDKSEWFQYWLYELEAGSKATPNSVSFDGKPIPIKTVDNLYDILTEKKE